MARNIELVVAMDAQRGIGKDNQLVWHLPEDMAYFKALTTMASTDKQNAVIMGRKTWESIPEKFRPLSNRYNCVLSHNPGFVALGATVFDDLERCLSFLNTLPNMDRIFVIGGGTLYGQAITHPACHRLWITHIYDTFDCDTFFPEIPGGFTRVEWQEGVSKNGVMYAFGGYIR